MIGGSALIDNFRRVSRNIRQPSGQIVSIGGYFEALRHINSWVDASWVPCCLGEPRLGSGTFNIQTMDSSSVDDDIFLAPTPKDIFTMSWAAFGAVSGTGLIVIAGAVFSAKGYLTAQSAKEISKLNLYFLTGSLMLFNLGDAITPAILRELWPIPVLVALFLFISWLLAKIGCFVLGIREHQNWVTACIAFSNNNNAPVSIIYALVFGGDAKKLQIPGQKLPKLEVLSRGLSYVFVFALFSNLVRWSYGYNLLVAKSATAAIEAEDEEVSSNNSSSSGVVPSSPPAPIPVSGPATPAYMPNHVSRTFSDRARHLEAVRRLSVGLGTDETQMDWTDEEFAAADLPNRRPNAINGRRPTSDEHRPLLGSYTAEPIDESNEQPQQEDEDETEPPTFWNRIKDSKAARIFQTLIGPFSNPPMVASLLGILFGLVAPLKGLIFGAEAPFRSLIGTPLRK